MAYYTYLWHVQHLRASTKEQAGTQTLRERCSIRHQRFSVFRYSYILQGYKAGKRILLPSITQPDELLEGRFRESEIESATKRSFCN
jgi:hypothetical protein